MRTLTLVLNDTDDGDIESTIRQFDSSDKNSDTEKAYRRVAEFMQQDIADLLEKKS